MSTCTIRPAAPGDEELILSFIRALADYERMSDQVVATPALLREWITVLICRRQPMRRLFCRERMARVRGSETAVR